eukprot:TRINITY_DN42_c0_g3_i1.p2 TRINITY_DN42_c0_g3~~TRINITY_DN42_c0_g3_i1.p2  ORF type:complete len:205 (+),score=91.43 TRINITY_DN42_c0_g3_i1:157-771(+)
MATTMAQPQSFKLVLLGETVVGKSSIVLRLVRHHFLDHPEPTIGAAFLTQVMDLPDQPSVKFEIWDTAGQERYKTLAPMYYRGAAAAVIVYDITNANSFATAKNWVNQLQCQSDASVVIALAGNKCDLSAQREVQTAEAKAYAEEKNLLFFECSAKMNTNIGEMFTAIALKLPSARAEKRPEATKTVQLGGASGKKKDGKTCAC